ncbi:MAG: c-type cytochrome [Gammaproteobacteria bacterium]|jgi:cytochrome c5
MSKDEDQVFLQNFLIIIVMLLGMISLLVILSRVIGSNDQAIAKQRAMVLIELTKPIGNVRLSSTSGSDIASAANTSGSDIGETVDPGKKIYESLCTSCHSTGLPNVPQIGSSEDWVDRIAQGELLLYERAINGFTGSSGMVMPAKGGNTSLSDDDIKAAVDYMVEGSQ